MAQLTRKNFEFSERYTKLLSKLKEVCDLGSEKDVVEEALVLLGWATGQVALGHSIGAYDKDQKVMREITTRALENARRDWEANPEHRLAAHSR